MTEFPSSYSNAKIIKGLYGSQAYYKFAGIEDKTFIGTGVAKNPLYPTSGKSGSSMENGRMIIKVGSCL